MSLFIVKNHPDIMKSLRIWVRSFFSNVHNGHQGRAVLNQYWSLHEAVPVLLANVSDLG